MKIKGKLPLNIQMFADPEPNEIDDLMEDLKDKVEPTPDPKVEPEVDPKIEPTPDPKIEPEVDPKAEPKVEVSPEENDDNEDKGGIKALREAHKIEKARAKELEEKNLSAKETTDKLIKAVKLGIKGETQEEILANLEDYEIKELAGKTGLTEAQVKKDAEIENKIKNLNEQSKEILFNRRAYELQKSKGLLDKDIVDFVKVAADVGIDLTSTSSKFETIYDRIMGPNNTKIISEKDATIASLEAQIQALKEGRAPEEGVKGNGEPIPEGDWEAKIAAMKGKDK